MVWWKKLFGIESGNTAPVQKIEVVETVAVRELPAVDAVKPIKKTRATVQKDRKASKAVPEKKTAAPREKKAADPKGKTVAAAKVKAPRKPKGKPTV